MDGWMGKWNDGQMDECRSSWIKDGSMDKLTLQEQRTYNEISLCLIC